MRISRRTRLRRQANATFANDFSFLNPELLAREAILRLRPQMFMGRLIAKNFDPKPAVFGDSVGIKRFGTFEMNRKDGVCDPIVKQNANGDRIQVRLDQWPQVSFQICDGEENRPVNDLVAEYLVPAVQALSEGVDRIAIGQVHRFYDGDVAGHLGLVSSTNVYDYLLEARDQLNANNAPEEGRIAILSGPTETAGLKNDLFVRVDASGSNDALRRASLGQISGFDTFRGTTVPSIRSGQVGMNGLVNNAAGYAAGAVTIAYDTATTTPSGAGDLTAGMWISIAGDETPQHITADSGGTNAAGNLTIYPGLRRAVVDNAVILGIKPGAVNHSGGYRGRDTNTGVPGWAKEITISGFTVAPQIGQGVSFGTGTDVYSVIKVNGLVGITLDRPLENAIADAASVNLMPVGQYNMALTPNALALIVRPLEAPRSGTGVQSKTINFEGYTIRVTVGYDINTQAHVVVLDFLAGISILDANLIVPMYG